MAQVTSCLGRLAMIIAVAVTFLFGLTSTVLLSLRSSEVKVPNIVGKDRMAAEQELGHVGLNLRQRATRATADSKPNVILDQSPRAGEIIKTGQTVAVVLSRAAAEGEAIASTQNTGTGENKNANAGQTNDNANRRANRNTNRNSNRRASNNSNNGNQSNSNNGNLANAGNRVVANKNANAATGANTGGNRNAVNASKPPPAVSIPHTAPVPSMPQPER